MLKVELHAHTDLDPVDVIPYSTHELIDHAARLHYDALAITLHDCYFEPSQVSAYARARGLTLIAGIERTIRDKHILLLNFSDACARVETFDDLARLKTDEPHGLVIAPHAAFPQRSAVGLALLDRYVELFDAAEVNGLFTRYIDFNATAVAWARARGKPLVGNCDLHSLDHLGGTYSLVDAHPDPDAICQAIRAGRVEVRATPLSLVRAGWTFGRMFVGGVRGRLRRLSTGDQETRRESTGDQETKGH